MVAETLVKLLGCSGGLERKWERWIFAGAGSSPALSERKKRGLQWGASHGKKWMRTPGARPLHRDRKQASSCVAGCVAASWAAVSVVAAVQAVILIGYCSRLYPTSFVVLQNSSKFWTEDKIPPKQKLFRILQTTNLLLVTKANSGWKMTNLTKQFEFQIPNWGNSKFWIGAD
jgi:hypothetical protein